MNNFEHFETRELNLDLLNEMYAIPSKELSTDRITEILSSITGMKLDNAMTSTIFNNAGLSLRERTRVTPKAVEVKPKRVTKAEMVSNILGLLGLTPAVNGEDVSANGPDDVEEEEVTEQESQYVDEMIETNQFSRVESIYANQNGTDVAV